MLLSTTEMCNQLFKSLINQSASACDKDVIGRTDSKPIVSQTSAKPSSLPVTDPPQFGVGCFSVSWYTLNPRVSIFFYFSQVWRPRLFASCHSSSLFIDLCLSSVCSSVFHACCLTSPPLCQAPIYFLYLCHPITHLHNHTCPTPIFCRG